MTSIDHDRRTLVRGAVINTVGTIAEGARAALPILFIHLYSSRDYGVFILCFGIVELLSRCVVTGFADGITYLGARHDGERAADGAGSEDADRRLYDVIANCFVWPLLLSIVLVIAVELFAGVLYRGLYAETQPRELVRVLQILAFLLPLNVFLQIPVATIKARLMMGYDVLINSGLLPISIIVFAVAFKLAGFSSVALAVAHVAGSGVAAVLAVWAFGRKFSVTKTLRAIREFRVDRELVRFSIPQSVNMMASYGLVRVDAVILAAFVAPESIALYSVANEVARFLRQLKLSFSSVFSPLVARKLGEGDRPGMQRALDLVTSWIATLTVPGLFVLLVFRREILAMYGQSSPASFYFLLMLGPLLSCLWGLAGNMLLMTGHSRLLLANSLAGFVINVVLNLLLIPPLGLLGAAIAIAATSVMLSLTQLLELRRLEGFAPALSAYRGFGVAAALFVPVAVLILNLPPSLQAGRLVPAGLAVRLGVGLLALGIYALVVLRRDRPRFA